MAERQVKHDIRFMTHASVFSGIGGPEVAATMLGWDNLFHCEINPFGRKVLDYWYPNSKSYEDITTTDFTEWRGRVDVLTGGFPCQPFSYAGRRRGAEDDRYLWPSMYRAIDEIQPTWVVAENVAGILTMVEQGEVSKVAGSATLFDAFDDLRGRYELRETFTLQRICTDLESHGYAVQPVLVPACAVGAPHRRDRVFIVARRLPAMDEGERGRTATDSESVGDNRTRREESRTDERQDGQTNREPIIGSGIRETRQPIADTSCECGERLRPEQSDISQQEQIESRRRSCQDVDNGAARNCHGYEWMQDREIRQRAQHIAEGIGTEDCGEYRVGQRWQDFPSVSPVHRGNDGLPFDVDRLALSFGKWRTEALKAYGNAIVPQVMYEIFRAIEIVEQREQR